MILDSIIIENIRSYRHQEIEFAKGISLFEGDIGSGKSTVLMSIEFALFGLGSQKAESLLAKNTDTGSVTLGFSVDDTKYEIKRILHKKNDTVSQDSKSSWIKTSGEKEPLSASELKQRVLQILKFNEPASPRAESRIFRYAVFTPQEAMKNVLSDPKKRLETIRKAFGMEDYDTAASNAHELAQQLKIKIGILQGKASNVSELESSNAESESKIVTLSSMVEDLTQTIQKQKSSESRLVAELSRLQEKDKERIKIEGQKNTIKDKIHSSKIQMEKIKKDIQGFEAELQENNSQIQKLRKVKAPQTSQSVEELDKSIAKHQKISDVLIQYNTEKNTITGDLLKLEESLQDHANADIAQIQQNQNNFQNQKNIIKDKLDDLQKKLDISKYEKMQKQTQKKSLESEINKFEMLENTCPTCEQPINSEYRNKLVEQRKNRVAQLEQEIQSVSDLLSKLKIEHTQSTSEMESCRFELEQLQRIIPAMQDYATKSSTLAQLEVKISQTKSQAEYGEDSLVNLKKHKDQLVLYKNAKTQENEIIQRNQRITYRIQENQNLAKTKSDEIFDDESKLQKLQESSMYDNLDDEITKADSQLHALRNDIYDVSNKLAVANNNKKHEETKIQENNEKIKEAKRLQEESNKISECLQWIESFFIPTLSAIEKQVLLSVLQNFNETYHRLYSILVDDPTKESRIDEEFTPVVLQDGYDQDVDYLSGGEKTSIALAYRLTLNSLMRSETESKSNLLILDEPTDGFSKNQIGKIRDLLDELKSEQIILVSHEKELESQVDNVFKISKQDGISVISRTA